MSQINSVPRHLGIVLDGNRRWAEANGLPALEGHRRGSDTLKTITKAAIDRGVSYVSAYVFSTENWERTPKEVKYLMELAYKLVTKEIDDLNKAGIRMLWLGSKERVSAKLLKAIHAAEESTRTNTRGTLVLCFNYGGATELVEAYKQLVDQGITSEDITQEKLESALYKPEVPPIDLLIRTSGEQRISGFMLYRAAYAELYFVKKHWPDFTVVDLDEALADYAQRQRRFGT